MKGGGGGGTGCFDLLSGQINDGGGALHWQEYELPSNLRATLDAEEAIKDAQFALLAVPCQHSRKFLNGVKPLISPSLPIICVSKGLELGTGDTMAQIVPSALGHAQPTCFLSGPSFAKEVMERRPTSLVAASKVRSGAQCIVRTSDSWR